SRRRHTRWPRDWSSDVCSSDLLVDRDEAAFVHLDAGVLCPDQLSVRAPPDGHEDTVELVGRGRLATLEMRDQPVAGRLHLCDFGDRKSTRLNSSHVAISYAVFC